MWDQKRDDYTDDECNAGTGAGAQNLGDEIHFSWGRST